MNTTSSAATPSPSGSSTLAPNEQPYASTPANQILSSQSDLMASESFSTRTAVMSSSWSSSFASLLYSSVSITPSSPAPTSRTQSPATERAANPGTQYIVAMVLGSTACIAIGLNIGWLVIRRRRRERERKEDQDKDDAASPKDRRSRAIRKPDRRAEVASYSKPQLDNTGIHELEADLAPAVAAVKPGVYYELEALEKPLELRATSVVATWLSRRAGGRRPRSRGPHASMSS